MTLLSRRYFPSLVTASLLLVTSLLVLSLAQGVEVTIARSGVSLYKRPGTQYDVVSQLESGESVLQVNSQGGWLEIRRDNGQQGWVPQWFLDQKNLLSDTGIQLVTSQETPVYAEPSLRSSQIGSLPADSHFDLAYESLGWVKVEDKGFVPLDQVQLQDKPTEEVHRPAAETITLEPDPALLADKVIMRRPNQALLTTPSHYGGAVADTQLGEEFVHLETVYDEHGNEFFLVERDDGIRGYLDTSFVALANASQFYDSNAGVTSLAEATIMLDPGHGGEDPGAISQDGSVYEKNIALATAQILKQLLENNGATVLMTRSEDRLLPLSDIARLSNQAQPDVFISLHFDGHVDQDRTGTSTYFYHEQDYDLAQSVNDQLAQQLPLSNNGVLFGNYLVIRENNQPSLLLELGYMSNNHDVSYIQSPEYHNQIASAIVQGLDNYFSQNE